MKVKQFTPRADGGVLEREINLAEDSYLADIFSIRTVTAVTVHYENGSAIHIERIPE